MSADDLRRFLPSPRASSDGPHVFALGLSALDDHLPYHGLSRQAVHEIHAASPQDLPATLGFLLSLLVSFPETGPIFIITTAHNPCGRLYGHGLNALGLDPHRLTCIETKSDNDALWAIEETMRSGASALTVGFIAKSFDLKKSQRLSLAAREARRPLLLLRPSQAEAASAADTRWRIAAAPAHRNAQGTLSGWRWRVRLERCRNGWPGEWVLEWSHASHRFGLATALADPALPDSARLVRNHSA